MTWLQYQLALMPEPDTILHIGAGTCSELEEYLRIAPQRIILVEPNPESVSILQQKTAHLPNVTVVQAAVASEAGRATLRMFNFAEVDSLREPTGLHELLPGLRQIRTVEVSAITPAQLIRRLNPENTGNNWLVLEAPGAETMVLEELNRIEALQHFSRLIVRTGAEPFYEGDSSAAALLVLLESFGYLTESAPDKDDPDWPRYHLKFQPLAPKCRELETRLQESQQQLTETTEERRAKAEEADALKSRLAELEKERDELDSTRRELSEQAEASARELDQAKAEWDKERHALNTEISSLNEKLENESKKCERLQRELEEKHAALDSARSDLAVAIRLQTLRENDLKELQHRYGQVLHDKEEQHELLLQLHQRLSKAAEYLQLAHAEGSAESLPEELREALVGEEEKSRKPHHDG